MADHRTDEDLLKDYGQGDFAAFEQLYARYRQPLYRYLLNLLGDETTANDLFQLTWEKVIKAAVDYSDGAPFKAWLFVVARNAAMDHFRQNTRRREDPLPEQMESATVAGPEHELSKDFQAKDLSEAIKRLPAEQRDTVMLRLAGGMKLETIARVTGVSTEAAKSRLRYATQKLKAMLGDSDE